MIGMGRSGILEGSSATGKTNAGNRT